MESLYRDKRSCHLQSNLGVFFHNKGIIWVHHKFWSLLIGVVILYSFKSTYGFSFEAISKLGYVKPSRRYPNQCLMQLPKDHVYRECSPSLEGPLMLDGRAKKIYFWKKIQFQEVRYYETGIADEKVITKKLQDVPKNLDIHIFYIPGNPFLALKKDPSPERYSLSLPPEQKPTIPSIKTNVPYRAGKIFGIEYSNIVYMWTEFRGNRLGFLHFNTKSKQNKFFYYSLERVPISLNSFTISELGGFERIYFAGSTRDFQQVCFFVINLKEWNRKVERGQPLDGNFEAYLCGKFSAFDKKDGYMEIEIFSITYPYSLSAHVLSQKFLNNYSSIIYFIYPNINKDHKFTKTKECGELYPKPESRYIICQSNGFQADYYNSVINRSLITRFDERNQRPVPHQTCYLFNDCYGCRLMELFNCSWEEDECVNTIKPRKPFNKCIKVINITSTDKEVTLALEGVRLTNTFMVVQMLANSTGEIYKPISISDYQATFGIDNRTRISSKFEFQISNSVFDVANLVEVEINFSTNKTDGKDESIFSPVLKIVLIAIAATFMVVIVLGLIVLCCRKEGGDMKDFYSFSYHPKIASQTDSSRSPSMRKIDSPPLNLIRKK